MYILNQIDIGIIFSKLKMALNWKKVYINLTLFSAASNRPERKLKYYVCVCVCVRVCARTECFVRA